MYKDPPHLIFFIFGFFLVIQNEWGKTFHAFWHLGKAWHAFWFQQGNGKKPVFQLTESFVGYPVDSQNKVVLEEDVSHNREEVDEDKRQHSCQNNWAAIAGYALYYIQQGFFSVNQVKELERTRV